MTSVAPGKVTAVPLAEQTLRVGVVCDYREEGWRSMDLAAAMLLRGLRQAAFVDGVEIRPRMSDSFRRFGGAVAPGVSWRLDRLWSRFRVYPRHIRNSNYDLDLYHVLDHSYSHLVHDLPADRTVVTCHDIDTFRSVLEPNRERRSPAFRVMTDRILSGFKKAARVICVSESTREDLLRHRVVPADRIRVIHNGIHEDYSAVADVEADADIRRMCGEPAGVELLHVGTTIPRKGLETLLRLFAGIRKRFPEARLLRAGGELTLEQSRLASSLKVDSSIVTLPFLSERQLAAVYRRASLVVLPSLAEGFGWPLAEAMACGAVSIASDIPALREVGGEAAIYVPASDVPGWVETAERSLLERIANPIGWKRRKLTSVERAQRFSQEAATRGVMQVYCELLGRNRFPSLPSEAAN